MKIESLQNARVKKILNLQQKSKLRKQEGLFVIEGKREVERAILSGYDAVELWVTAQQQLPNLNHNAEVVYCSTNVFNKIVYRDGASQICGVFKSKNISLETTVLPKNALVIVLENIEKPGNIGAVLRTCNALGADAVLLADCPSDLYNPNLIRNSLGGFFNLQIVENSSAEIISFLKEKEFQIITTHLKASTNYLNIDYTKPSALVFGSEAKGVSEQWVKSTSKNVIIEMNGVVDSLNISVAAAIILAEAVRQRY